MKVYFAHSFDDSRSPTTDPSSGDSAVDTFLRKMEMHGITVLDPAKTTIPWPDYEQRFQFCLNEIQNSDVLVVDASNKLGIGVGAEMMHARKLNIAVFAICPDSSHYRRSISDEPRKSEWIHPFIFGLSTKVFRSLDECVDEVSMMSSKPEAVSV